MMKVRPEGRPGCRRFGPRRAIGIWTPLKGPSQNGAPAVRGCQTAGMLFHTSDFAISPRTTISIFGYLFENDQGCPYAILC
jgi:hypothetical protein